MLTTAVRSSRAVKPSFKRTSMIGLDNEVEDIVGESPGEDCKHIIDNVEKPPEGADENGKGKEREYKVPEDIYALIFVYGPGGAFVYGSFILLLQISAIFLFYWDLLEVRVGGNLFNVPYGVPPQVTAAQGVAVPLCILCHQDFRNALYQLGALYDPDVKKKFPYATRGKWILVVYLRLFVGFALAFISWIQTIQASTVTDLFLNIEAIIFVGEVDELGFWLADKNFLTQSLKDCCEATKGLSFHASEGHRRTWARRFVAWISFLILLFGWAFVYVKQSLGVYHDVKACHTFSVYFGDYTLGLNTSKIDFTGFNRSYLETLQDGTNYEMVYSSFSGTYAASTMDESPSFFEVFRSRPRYYETVAGVYTRDSSLGSFRYCGEYWIFTIEALNDAVDRDEDLSGFTRQDLRRWNGDCENWLLRSPRTKAYTLEDVGSDGWVVWTGKVEDATDFDFGCEDCRTDVDCNLQGVCMYPVAYQCLCSPGHFGLSCEVEPCPLLEAYEIGSSSKDYNWIGSFSPLNAQTLGPLGLHTEALLLYDRPVYASSVDQDVSLYMYFLGSRWSIAMYDIEDARSVFIETSAAHGFWDDLHSTAGLFFSEPTTSGSPVGLQWFSISESRSRGSFGPFLANSPENLAINCRTSNCEGRNKCGVHGECNVETLRCECSDCYGGYFCEHPPDSAYSKEQFNSWLRTDMTALEGTDYFREYWEGLNASEACPELVEAFFFNNSQSKTRRLISFLKKTHYTKRNLGEYEGF